LEDELELVELRPPSAKAKANLEMETTCEVKDGTLRIGNTKVDVFNAESKMKVPDVLFYENSQVNLDIDIVIDEA
jgi:hypothetical protein